MDTLIAPTGENSVARKQAAKHKKIWTAKSVLAAVEGEWIIAPPRGWSASRIVEMGSPIHTGDLVFSTFPEFCEPNADEFQEEIDRLVAAGAKALVVGRRPQILPSGLAMLRVDNRCRALENMAVHAREIFEGKVVAIAGSAGASIVNSALQFVAQRLSKDHQTSDTSTGLGPTICAVASINPANKTASFAIDHQRLGDPTCLSGQLRPDVGVITGVSGPYFGHFSSEEGVAANLAEIFATDGSEMVAVLNRDDPSFDILLKEVQDREVKKVITFGRHTDADCRLLPSGKIKIGAKRVTKEVSVPNDSWAGTFLAVLATAHALRFNLNKAAIALAELISSVSSFELPIKGGSLQVVTAENLPPQAGVEALGLMEPEAGGRRVVVLCDLQGVTEQSSADLAGPIRGAGIDCVMTLGSALQGLRDILPKNLLGRRVPEIDEFLNTLYCDLHPGDVVTVLGESSTPIIEALRIRAEDEGFQREPLWNAEEIAEITDGEWIVPPSEGWVARGFNFYENLVRPGDLVVTTSQSGWKKDKFTDTRGLVRDFFAMGAAAVITDKLPPKEDWVGPLLSVKLTRKATDRLAEAARNRMAGKVVCLTGTAGKTTSKDALGHILGKQASTFKSRRSMNATHHVSQHLAQTPPATAYGVYELCVSKYVARVSGIARPDVVLITNIHAKHVDIMGSVKGLATGKAKLMSSMAPGGTAVLNRDDDYFGVILGEAKKYGVENILTFGADPKSDVRLLSMQMDKDGTDIEIEIAGRSIKYRLQMPGRHWVSNSLGILAVVHALGADVERAAADYSEMPVLEGRGEVHDLPLEAGTFRLINDAFSSTPVALSAGLEVMAMHTPGKGGRRIAVLGDMGSLGEESERYHRAIVNDLRAANVDCLFTIGTQITWLHEELGPDIRAYHARTNNELYVAVTSFLRAGDLVYVKGSGSVKLQVLRVAQRLGWLAQREDYIGRGFAMTFTANRELSGANFYAARSVFRRTLDLDWMRNLQTSILGKDFAKGLVAQFPELLKLASDEEITGAFIKQLQSDQGAPIPKTILYIILSLQLRAGIGPGFAKAIGGKRADPCHLVWEYSNRKIAIQVSDLALKCFGQLLPDNIKWQAGIEPFDFDEAYKDFKKSVTKHHPSSAMLKLGHLAEQHDIPWQAVGKNKARLGQGKYQKAIDIKTKPDIDLLFPPGAQSRIPVIVITGLSARNFAARILVHVLQNSGVNVGLLDEKGVFVGGELQNAEQSKGTHPIEELLMDRRVDAIVRQISSKEVYTRGLGHDSCETSAIMSVEKKNDDTDLTQRKNGAWAISASTRGKLVVGADDPVAMKLTRTIDPRRLVLVSEDAENEKVARHILKGGAAVVLERLSPGPMLVFYDKGELQTTVPFGSISAARRDDAPNRRRGCLFAAALAYGMGIELNSIVSALEDLKNKHLRAPEKIAVKVAPAPKVQSTIRPDKDTAKVSKNLQKLSKQREIKLVQKDGVKRRRGTPHFGVLFVGDTGFGENYQDQYAARGSKHLLNDKGYDYPLAKVRGALIDADLVVANLETPVTNVKESPFAEEKSWLHWSDVDKAPDHLRSHNIDIVSLANNHTFDFGDEGFEQTLDVLSKKGVICLGGGKDERDASAPLVIDASVGASHVRIAVISSFDASKKYREKYTKQAGKNTGGLDLLDPKRIAKKVRKLKAADPDILVIAFPHWGPNYKWRSKRQDEFADKLLDAGVDLIIGHGAHMLQQFEQRDGRWVVFSIGNFVFNSLGRYEKMGAPPYSMVAKLIVESEQGALKTSLRLYPTLTDNKVTKYQTRFVTDGEFRKVKKVLTAEQKSDVVAISDVPCGRDEFGPFFELEIKRQPIVNSAT